MLRNRFRRSYWYRNVANFALVLLEHTWKYAILKLHFKLLKLHLKLLKLHLKILKLHWLFRTFSKNYKNKSNNCMFCRTNSKMLTVSSNMSTCSSMLQTNKRNNCYISVPVAPPESISKHCLWRFEVLTLTAKTLTIFKYFQVCSKRTSATFATFLYQ